MGDSFDPSWMVRRMPVPIPSPGMVATPEGAPCRPGCTSYGWKRRISRGCTRSCSCGERLQRRLTMRFWTLLACGFLWSICVTSARAEQHYQHPPQEILEVMNAPAPPVAFPAPTGDALLLARPLYYPPISDLAEPLL